MMSKEISTVIAGSVLCMYSCLTIISVVFFIPLEGVSIYLGCLFARPCQK